MNTYIIEWKSKTTGATGKGTEYMDYYQATQYVKLLNKEHPEIHHKLAF